MPNHVTNQVSISGNAESLAELNYVEFDTAWSPPEPVFAAIVKAFPELHLEVRYIDEGGGFAGTFYGKDGCLYDEPCPDDDFKAFAREHFYWIYDDEDD